MPRARRDPLRQIDDTFRFNHEPGTIGAALDKSARLTVTAGRQWPTMNIGLVGAHQAANAALAVVAVEELAALGLAISDEAVALGLATVEWPARLEVMGRQPLVLLDCAHNVASAEALAQTLDTSVSLANGRRYLIFAGSDDKDLAGMLRVLAPRFDHLALTRFAPSPRTVPPEKLAKLVPPGTSCELFESAASAWQSIRARAGE